MTKNNLLSMLRTGIAVAGIGLAGLVGTLANASGYQESSEQFNGRVNDFRTNYVCFRPNSGFFNPKIYAPNINSELITKIILAFKKAPISTQKELSEITLCTPEDFKHLYYGKNSTGKPIAAAFAYGPSIFLVDDSKDPDFSKKVLHEFAGHVHEDVIARRDMTNYSVMTQEWERECSDKSSEKAIFSPEGIAIWVDEYPKMKEFQEALAKYNSSNEVLVARGNEFRTKVKNDEFFDREELARHNSAITNSYLKTLEFKAIQDERLKSYNAPRNSFISAYASIDFEEDRAELTAYAIERPEVVRNHLLTTDPKSAELLMRKLKFLKKWKYIDSETYDGLVKPMQKLGESK